MNTQNVLEKLRLLRDMTDEDAQTYLPLVQDAVQRLEGKRIRVGGDSLLETAAAALVNWQISLTEPDGDFTAGEVHFTGGNTNRNTKRIWLDARNAAAPYLHDEAFAFRSIP
ncbi:MAG: hypothetical protein PHE09_05470 [Oscillospiraceae bacterium]|jgi:hypothetical protein|nr:hypothetical protein [Oscillospiraceae bacterium]